MVFHNVSWIYAFLLSFTSNSHRSLNVESAGNSVLPLGSIFSSFHFVFFPQVVINESGDDQTQIKVQNRLIDFVLTTVLLAHIRSETEPIRSVPRIVE